MMALILAAAVVVTPCVDEVTVRERPSVKAARVGVITRGAQVEVKSVGTQRERLELTVDRNVPAPFSFKPNDVWLEVKLATDAGETSGFVYGGLMCRRTLLPTERWVSLVGWSSSSGKVALLEYATDSFACGWGRPATLRVIDTETGVTLDALEDGCPAAELLLSRRAQVDALLDKHAIALTWTFEVLAPGSLVASAPSCRDGQCTLRVLEQEGTPPRSADGEVKVPGKPKTFVSAVVQLGDAQLAVVRVQSSEEVHQFTALRLRPLEAWRDAVKDVHLTTKVRGACVGLEGTAKNAAAKQALAALNVELARKLRRHYREQYAGSDDAGFCLAGAGLRDGKLELQLVAPNCVGNECPGDACKVAHRFLVSGGVVTEGGSTPFADYSCDP